MLAAESIGIFLYRGLKVAGFIVQLPQGGTGIELGIFSLEVDALRLRTGCLYFALVLEDREGKSYYNAIQRMAAFRVSAVAQFESRKPALAAY